MKKPSVLRGFITIVPNGMPQMGPKLFKIFLYYILVGIVVAYFVSRTLAADADYLAVFRVAGATAFVAYGMAYFQDSIWLWGPNILLQKTL